MPKSATNEWDATASNNTDVGSINIAENCAAGNINNALREIMAQIATARTGSDAGIVTGTAGSDGQLAAWNADGDLEGGTSPVTLTATDPEFRLVDDDGSYSFIQYSAASITISVDPGDIVASSEIQFEVDNSVVGNLSSIGRLFLSDGIAHRGDTDNFVSF